MSTVKRRQRTSRACSFCKRRKIKCDMNQPCSSCVRYGCLECVYNLESNKVTETTDQSDKIQKEITALEDRINHLKMSLSDTAVHESTNKDLIPRTGTSSYIKQEIYSPGKQDIINLHDGYINKYIDSFRFTGKGPLSWFSLMKIDYNMNKALISLSENGELQVIQQKIEENNRSLLGLEYNVNSFCQNDSVKPKKIDEASSLKHTIMSYLPDDRVLSLLMDRFFTHIFSGLHIVNEQMFKRQVSEVIQYRIYYASGALDPTDLPEAPFDLAFLGILLVSMRFAYLSLFSINGKIHDYGDFRGRQDIAKLFSYPVTVEAIKLAKCCLDQFDLTKVSRLDVFQLALILRYYKHFCPEEGDGADSGDYSMLTSRLFDMAYSLGLERDPNHGLCEDEDEKDLRRALWFVLVLIDKTNAMTTGAPLNYVKFTFDTELPRIVCHDSKRKDGKPFKSYAYFDYLFQIIKLTTDVRGVDINELLSKIKKWEDVFLDYSSISVTIAPSHGDQFFAKVLRHRIYLNGSAFLISLYFHLFTFYERKGDINLGGQFFEKLILKIKDVMLCCYDLLDNNEQIFKGSTDLWVISSLLSSIHKSLVVLCALISRVNLLSISRQKGSFDRMEDVHRLQTLLETCHTHFMRAIKIFSGKYFYASIIDFLQQKLWTKCNDNELYDTFPSNKLFKIGIPLERVERLSDEISKALKNIEDHSQTQSSVLDYNYQTLEEVVSQNWMPDDVNSHKVEGFGNCNFPTNDFTDIPLGQVDSIFEDLISFDNLEIPNLGNPLENL